MAVSEYACYRALFKNLKLSRTTGTVVLMGEFYVTLRPDEKRPWLYHAFVDRARDPLSSTSQTLQHAKITVENMFEETSTAWYEMLPEQEHSAPSTP